MSAILTAALSYAGRGWAVFPCHPATKAPLTKRGLKEASADEGVIRQWWARWPEAMIGLPLGGATGLFALDFDPREETDPETGEIVQFTYRQLREDVEALLGRELPATAASRTPSGGFHVFYRQPDGEPLGNRKGRLPRHVDVRGLGGYVIAPPSVRADGRAYEWVEGRDPEICAPVDVPAELVALLRGEKEITQSANPSNGLTGNRAAEGITADEAVRKYGLAALDRERDQLARTGSGGRNQALNNAALALGSLVAAGALSEAMARAALQEAAQANGLWADDGARACLATIDSGMKAGLRSPRDLSEIRAEAQRRGGRVGSSRGRGLAPARTAAQPAASTSAADPSAPPAPPGGSEAEFRPSHAGGKRRKRGWRWGPRGEDGKGQWDWMWVWELVDGVRLNHRCIHFALTDLGNAERFQARHGWRFRYTEMRGWFAWDGKRWVREGAEAELLKAAQDTVRAIQREAEIIAESGANLLGEPRFNAKGDLTPFGRAVENAYLLEHSAGMDEVLDVKDGKLKMRSGRHAAWGRASEASARIKAIPELVRGLPGITVKTDVFDADTMVFNVENGALHFIRPAGDEPARFELRPHDPELLLTKVAPVIYDPAAQCPTYDAFLAKVQPDPAVRRFLHAWAGYNLTGDVGQQCFVILHGAKGANGKSTWENLRGDMMGDYSLSVKVQTFMKNDKHATGTEASPDIARLPGARHVRTSEPGQQEAFAEDLIKVVTGSERMVARMLHKDFFEFDPQFKITVQCNRAPKATDDPAFWRRVKMVPFDVSIPEPERIEADVFRAMLRREASGVLNHFLAGALDWMTGGLPTVDRIVEATAAYRERSDVLGSFLRAATRPEDGATVGSHELFQVYSAWCVFAGEKAWTQKGFSTALHGAGYEKVKASSMRWQGLRLIRDAEAFVTREWVGDGKSIDRPREEMGPELEGLEPLPEEREGLAPNPPTTAADGSAQGERWADDWD